MLMKLLRLLLKWSLCNQQHHEIRIQGIANYVIEYVTEAKNDAVQVCLCTYKGRYPEGRS